MRIGLISDTHGLVRPQALAFLRGCDAILHAGDIVEPTILDLLAGIAPLTAVRGNNDHGAWAERLPLTATVQLGGIGIYVLHDIADLARHPAPAGARVVVSGHSHRPLVREEGGVLFVNPGSAGPRRFSLPISVGELRLEGGAVRAVTVPVGA
ncbi:MULTISPECIES: metallophosphoesterase family protein [Ramlibacter]|uniref:Phosphoesterase n=1 Tax=Ramlibacter pinisoli TaxID=2682844 RepID=A0A6N8ISK4_9BURK|nr:MULTISPECIES: metallophosphoesterase family protein [Ramlibacter]MBA2964590.1 metallophosphoesterase family protein [Ramlibacter sp. CGMCC 1.13660]MVQ29555.1 YfcE family phosphodiesterase [Ramlibacter pinisoli]